MTLPSNSSSKFYPNNTLARFITKLHSSVELSGDWEVALSEIHFPRTWYTIPKEGVVFTVDCKACVDPPFDKKYYSHIVHSPSDEFPKVVLIEKPPREDLQFAMRLRGGYYENMEELVREMNFETLNKCAHNHIAKEASAPKIKYSELSKRTSYQIPIRHSMTFPPSLCTILGLGIEQSTLRSIDGKTIMSEHVSDIDGGIHSLYVYCDLLEHVIVGDTSAPLLRLVDAKGKNGDMQHRCYDPPRYVPLRKKNFDCVEIDIRDDLGQPIAFESGKLSVTLHFRRAKNPYFV